MCHSGGGPEHVLGVGIWDLSVPFVLFCCEPKTLKKIKCLKNEILIIVEVGK